MMDILYSENLIKLTLVDNTELILQLFFRFKELLFGETKAFPKMKI